ncbi:hypothetical protein [Streptomyces sp. CC77]|uniref:hypothetical protein n=1 Tax=Streptomyces sp. CC77 TaxID=1906739 RepID=UPI0008DD0065|nr:hypothetical protein [Streptomyces sp. CC77]OII67071.1 hypothetical protein BJP39_07355 [Streptomyces sp. CC77]
MDLDAITDELYGLPPGDFTAIRNARAQAARAAGDRELAEQIRRLRRPTLAAWAGNLLVRRQPEEAERLLRLGEALRQAHRDLDGGQLKELSARQHELAFALSRHADQLTAEAGHRIGEDARREVQDTLHAVLADPEAAEQWARGRLARPLGAPVGFPAPSGGRPAPRPASRRPAGGAAETADPDAAPTRRREQEERLQRARQQAADAERELRDRQDELAVAEEELSRAEGERHQVEERAAELSRQLKDAERGKRRNRETARAARDRARQAERDLREARRRAEDTAAHARDLAGRTRHGV